MAFNTNAALHELAVNGRLSDDTLADLRDELDVRPADDAAPEPEDDHTSRDEDGTQRTTTEKAGDDVRNDPGAKSNVTKTAQAGKVEKKS
jgi:hypothetical protein